MIIRPIEPTDGAALLEFAQQIPPEEAGFFRGEQIFSERVDKWAISPGALRLAALDKEGEPVAAYIAVIPGAGLSRHVGEISLVVSSTRRREGLGKMMARSAVVEAFAKMKLSKLVVEVVAHQEGLARMFKRLGFEAEALLRNHLRDDDGHMKDLLLFSHFADDSWADLAILGVPRELGR